MRHSKKTVSAIPAVSNQERCDDVGVRTLYLLRHAKSDWADEGVDDFDRPLSPRGVRDAGRMAHHFLDKKIRPDVILCSPALRTRQTLALTGVAEHDAEVRYVEKLYGADADDVMAVVTRMPNHAKSVMVLGHNPTMSDLVGQDMPTCALATITVPTKHWLDAARSTFEVVDVVTPKMLRVH
jgi:phosphohistidine phosphatase